MSKYNLIDFLPEGMSDKEYSSAKEADRRDKHPEGDKIKAIQKMMSKEKSMKEMTGETFERIDGMIDQNLKSELMETFMDIKNDLIANDEMFDDLDLIDYLAGEMQNAGRYSRRFEGDDVEEASRPGYDSDGRPKSNDEMSDDEREDFYNDGIFDDEKEDKELKEHFKRFI